MTKVIQIAPLRDDYQRIIDFDRQNPSDQIIVFVTKSDTDRKSNHYKKIEESLTNLRNYCELSKIGFNMQVIELSQKKNFLNVIFDFTKSFLLNYEENSSYLINLGDSSLILNIALLQASTVLKSIFEIDIIAHLEESCYDELISFDYNLVTSFKTLLTTPVSLRLLNCIDQGMNFTDIEQHYKQNNIQISLGTISNHISQLESLGLISGKRFSDRMLTDLGKLIKEILEFL